MSKSINKTLNNTSSISPAKLPNAIYDLTKFILSIMVVAIHTSLFPNILYPWLRLAVPIFFIISSYFLFSKIKKEPDVSKQKIIIITFVKRNLKLYLFWFICLFPITIITRNYFKDGLFMGIIYIIRGLLFNSTFKASWFIMATVLGTVIIYYLSKKFNTVTLFVICIVIYIFICFSSSYFYIFKDNTVICAIKNSYELIFTPPANSFPVSLIWITCGKIFAEYEHAFFKKRTYAWIGLVISALLLYFEWLFINKQTGVNNNDCYIMLIPMSICIFSLIYSLKLQLKYSLILRNLSTFTYALHASLAYCLSAILKRFDITSSLILFICTLIICWICGLLIIRLKNIKPLSWLKYSM